jgi:hypothetical protein
MRKNIITGIVYFLAGVASVELFTLGLELMSKQSTLSFWSGLAIVGSVGFFIGYTLTNVISKFLNRKNK